MGLALISFTNHDVPLKSASRWRSQLTVYKVDDHQLLERKVHSYAFHLSVFSLELADPFELITRGPALGGNW